jgi:hypothetical protein
MLNFIANAFKGFFSFVLWINLIASVLIGYSFGQNIGTRRDNYAILGAIIGLIGGMIFNVLWGGLIAIFLRIDENIKILVKISGGKPIENGIEIAQNSMQQAPANKNDADLTAVPYTTLTATASVALRKRPETSSSYAVSINAGDSLMLINTEKDAEGSQWCLVRTKTGDEGWCQSEYLQEK